jgi:hypothetical protein
MSILAIDLGTRTGWALRSSGQIFSGYVDFKTSRHEGGGYRYLRFRRWLDEQWLMKPSAVYYEEVRHIYGGLLATLTAWCEEHKIPYCGVGVGTIKKFVANKGNASKEEVLAAIHAKGYEDVLDDNQADALAILFWAIAETDKE